MGPAQRQYDSLRPYERSIAAGDESFDEAIRAGSAQAKRIQAGRLSATLVGVALGVLGAVTAMVAGLTPPGHIGTPPPSFMLSEHSQPPAALAAEAPRAIAPPAPAPPSPPVVAVASPPPPAVVAPSIPAVAVPVAVDPASTRAAARARLHPRTHRAPAAAPAPVKHSRPVRAAVEPAPVARVVAPTSAASAASATSAADAQLQQQLKGALP